MTPERARMLEAVAEAAKAWHDIGEGTGQHRAVVLCSALEDAVDALRAHDAAPQVVGETVELRINAWHHHSKDQWSFEMADDDEYEDASSVWTRIATITASVPLPVVPVIAATVEEVKR